MSNTNLAVIDWEIDVEDLITEDDTPVDNFFQAQQTRLLVEPLYSSWRFLDAETQQPRKFLATGDVGVFYSKAQPPIVPDMFLSLDVEPFEFSREKKSRAYFVWEYDKVPEVAVEIVSNKEGDEMTRKFNRYAQMGVEYYIIFDDLQLLSDERLRVYEGALWKRYRQREDFKLPNVGLSLKVWHGEFENLTADWLRWCDSNGNLIMTGAERADMETGRANAEATARRNAESEIARLQAELKKMMNERDER